MELGNMCFGNSRGNFEIPREIIDSQEWQTLMHELIQVEDYHCTIGEYYEDYDNNLEYKKRTSPIPIDEFGGCSLEVDGKVIFTLFPYYWGDCTCGAEEKNEKLEKQWEKELFTKSEWNTYMTFDEWCDDSCPAFLKNKTPEELVNICTCGAINKNLKLKKKKEKIKDKIKEFERREAEEFVEHKKDCLLLKHNFVYHPNQEDEFWIDWYKYPFRDSYCNKDLNKKEILDIFQDCINQFLKKYNSQ